MAIIHAMVGASGSGKSTFAARLARETGFEIVCPDTIRGELTGDESSQAANAQVFTIVPLRLRTCLKLRGGVIYDATNYNEKNRKTVYEVAECFGAEIKWYLFSVPYEELVRRQGLRTRRVPDDVIKRQVSLLTVPTKGSILYK